MSKWPQKDQEAYGFLMHYGLVLGAIREGKSKNFELSIHRKKDWRCLNFLYPAWDKKAQVPLYSILLHLAKATKGTDDSDTKVRNFFEVQELDALSAMLDNPAESA
jgi:hypothetical protein